MFDKIIPMMEQLFNELNFSHGLQIKAKTPTEFVLTFESFESFRYFYTDIARSIPGEISSEKPFVLMMKFITLPKSQKEKDLIEIMKKKYKKMHIPMNEIQNLNDHIFELRFPSAQAYFTSFLELMELTGANLNLAASMEI
jgi:hypothetical protein